MILSREQLLVVVLLVEIGRSSSDESQGPTVWSVQDLSETLLGALVPEETPLDTRIRWTKGQHFSVASKPWAYSSVTLADGKLVLGML